MLEVDACCSKCMHNKTCKYMEDYVEFGDKLYELVRDQLNLNEPECANIQITCRYAFKEVDCYMRHK